MKREFRELGSKADDDKWVWTAEKNKFMEDMAECVSSLTKRVIDLETPSEEAELLLAKLAAGIVMTKFGFAIQGKEYKKLQDLVMVLDRKEKEWLNLSLKEDK